ncbi:MAG: hypothetical protein ACRD3T_14825 [Terriglobia bacterium]
MPPRIRLRGQPRLNDRDAQQIRGNFEKFRDGLPQALERYVLETYGIDLASDYGGLPLKNPFGKASGQLSLARHQVEKDATGGLGFVVLKTVIAQDQSGGQTMREWVIPETRMQVEHIQGRSGKEGWNVAWKGRGWFDTFEAYCRLFEEALGVANTSGMLVAPSVKYHLPAPHQDFWKKEEYTFTTSRLLDSWRKYRGDQPMPLEKDFSPTLAGSSRAAQEAKILEWLRTVPTLIHRAAPGKVRVGLKLFNALFGDSFQSAMLETVHESRPGEDRADFLVYANRLFDPAIEFEGKVGLAYGGPDLSERNLAVLERFLSARRERAQDRGGRHQAGLLALSATGDISSGRMAVEYLLRGASSFQMHTLFQLPDREFSMNSGNKTQKALHYLLFHPEEGFIAWLLDLRERLGLASDASIRQIADRCRNHWDTVTARLIVHRRNPR